MEALEAVLDMDNGGDALAKGTTPVSGLFPGLLGALGSLSKSAPLRLAACMRQQNSSYVSLSDSPRALSCNLVSNLQNNFKIYFNN
jgi:hypothetical protein